MYSIGFGILTFPGFATSSKRQLPPWGQLSDDLRREKLYKTLDSGQYDRLSGSHQAISAAHRNDYPVKRRRSGSAKVWYSFLAAAVIIAATVVTAATAAVAAKTVSAAAEENNQNQDNPQAAAAAPTAKTTATTIVIATHRQDPPIQVGDHNADLSPSYAGGYGLCVRGIKKEIIPKSYPELLRCSYSKDHQYPTR